MLWDVASGEQAGELTGATGGAMRLAFSPDGSLAAMGGTAGELLRGVASRGLIRHYTGHRRIVTQVLFPGTARAATPRTTATRGTSGGAVCAAGGWIGIWLH